MQTKSQNHRGAALSVAAGIPLLTLLSLLQPVSPATAAGGQNSAFQAYKDPTLGYALAKPTGWTVHADDHSITVESPDRSELLLTELFHAAPGETAAHWLEKLGDEHAAQFPDAHIDRLEHQRGKGDEIVAAMHYQGTGGTSQLRVLCSVVNGKGLLYAFAAPTDRFPAERPRLIHIAKSLVFTVPKTSDANRNTDSRAQAAAAVRQMRWVTWTDPREHAFTVSVPKGWQAIGGALRAGETDVRIAVGITSPDKNISIVLGDPRLGTFTGPNQFTRPQEGHNGVLHYMHADEFNAFYLHELVSQSIDNLKIGPTQGFPESDRLATETANQQAGPSSHEISSGLTLFTGTDKISHKPIEGSVYSVTRRMTTSMGGLESTTWTANPEILTCVAGDSSRWPVALTALHHLESTFREDPAWVARRGGEIQKATNGALAATAARSRQIARDNAVAENAIMSRYESHRAAQDNQQRGFINYIGDRTDVADDAGHTANVGSGMSHYYRNDRTGTIMGTDSAYSPGVDFTPMTEY